MNKIMMKPPVKAKTAESPKITLHVPPSWEMTDDEFYEFCRINRDLQLERTAEGDIHIMAPAGLEPSHKNAKLTVALGIWAEKDGTGIITDSSGGFILPNGATRA